MKVEVAMPRLSDSMTEGSVTSWFKNEGDAVKKGEALAELETEKSTVDLESPADGVLARIVVEAGGEPVPVDTVLCEIETEAAAGAGAAPAGKKAAAPSAKAGKAGAAAQPSATKPADEEDDSTAQQAGPSAPERASAKTGTDRDAAEDAAGPASANEEGAKKKVAPAAAGNGPLEARSTVSAPTRLVAPRKPAPAEDEDVPATPLARRMAAQAGLTLASLSRTGIGGKVCKADIEAALGASRRPEARAASAATAGRAPSPAAAPAVAGKPEPLSRVRRTIAERMARSKATIPHFYLSVDCRVDRLLAVRETLKADGVAVSVNDFIVRAAALALRRVPEANASWTDDGIVRHERVDIAVAVALDEGLVTPVVRSVDALGLVAIGEAVRDLAARAREGRLAPKEYDGGTFTVSNLGMHGIGEMYAIVNPPQACILGVGAAEPRAVVEGGAVVAGTVMTLSISADHRVLDGTTGARLLAEIRRLLEEPARMLA